MLQVVGAGLGRTGTHSLKLALERLLDGPCYHMIEVWGHPDHLDMWRRAALGEQVEWSSFLGDYVACVDWPGCSFWREMADDNPDAIILLSTRETPEAWWTSASQTIFEVMNRPEHLPPDFAAMIDALFGNRFSRKFDDQAAQIDAYERHNAEVRATADRARLVEWTTGDGWEPICNALGVPVPDDPFPHANTTDDFRAMAGLRDAKLRNGGGDAT